MYQHIVGQKDLDTNILIINNFFILNVESYVLKRFFFDLQCRTLVLFFFYITLILLLNSNKMIVIIFPVPIQLKHEKSAF